MKYYIKSTDIKSTLRVLFLCLMAATNGQENTKLFSLISPEHSGVTFNNTLKDNKTENILLYSNFYGGAGVGIGDFNQDGLDDIFFAGNQVSDQLYFNKGDFNFENAENIKTF